MEDSDQGLIVVSFLQIDLFKIQFFYWQELRETYDNQLSENREEFGRVYDDKLQKLQARLVVIYKWNFIWEGRVKALTCTQKLIHTLNKF